MNRGIAYDHKGEDDRAITDYAEAIRLEPKDPDAYIRRGDVYNRKGDYDRAIADYGEAIRFDPQNAHAYTRRGNVYSGKGDYNRAIADLGQAVRLNPKHTIAYLIRGVAYIKKGDYDRAIADLEQAVRLDPNDPKAYVIRGAAYDGKGDYNHAIADYDEALRLDPNLKSAAVNKRRALEHEQDGIKGEMPFDPQIWGQALSGNKDQSYDPSLNAVMARTPQPTIPTSMPNQPAANMMPQQAMKAPKIPPMPANLPEGSLYSPSRNMWKSPDGTLYNYEGIPLAELAQRPAPK